MVVNFNSINLKEQPVLVLRNADGTAIQTLGYAFNLRPNIYHNETSTITFDIPAFVDGEATPHYDDVIGMRIIDMVGWGQFILVNPSVEKTGVKEIKRCKAYSLEYELTYKKMSLPEGTYNFWNPVAPEETVVGIILSYLPSWSVGSIDESLVGKYRTFSEDNVNIYNFIKSTLQRTYNCIFDFDTYNRKIYVRSTSDDTRTAPIYISLNNLAKEIKVDEDTESIFTRLDVNGADGVNIRSVNPMGNNKIYNLDYFMSTSHFDHEMVMRWNAWKSNFESNQLLYHNTSIEMALKLSAILTEEAALAVLSGQDLAILENQKAIYAQHLATLIDQSTNEYQDYKRLLNETNEAITAKQNEIASQQDIITSLELQRDLLTAQLSSIRDSVSFSNFFSEDEILILDRYFKEDSIQDSSFVLSNVDAYIGDGDSNAIANMTVAFGGGTVKKILGISEKDLFTIKSGVLTCRENTNVLNAEVISASFERTVADNKFVLSALLGSGTFNGALYPGGSISITGTSQSISHNAVQNDTDISSLTGTELSIEIATAKMYFTKDTTEYERHAVEWELFEYGHECLSKLAFPSFSFDVSVANFFALEDFISFAQNLELGQKIYLAMSEEKVLQPILIGVEADFENLSSMKLKFGDRYTFSDSKFELIDLLDQSISMGKTVDVSKLNYNAFIESGASTAVKEFMDSALDVSKNAILSGENMAISWDSSGMRFRKYNEFGGFDPQQIGVINNSIVFTDDNWSTAKMAIGRFRDKNVGDVWGIVCPNLVGTLLAGANLVIESAKQDGGVAVFRVDESGARLYNSTFDIVGANTQITLNPYSGFAIGRYPLYDGDNYTINTDNAKFWVDTDGNVNLKGTLHGADGVFGGTLSGASGDFSGVVTATDFYFKTGGSVKTLLSDTQQKIPSDYLNLLGLNVGNGNLVIDSSGNISMRGNITMTSGSITWSAVNTDPVATNAANLADNAYSLASSASNNASSAMNITQTIINGTQVISPSIAGGTITGNTITGGTINSSTINSSDIYWGTYGSLTRGYGFNGSTYTNIVSLSSYQGLVLEAQGGGLRIQSNQGVYLGGSSSYGPIHIWVNGGYVNLTDVIAALIAGSD